MEHLIKYKYNKMELAQFANFEENYDKDITDIYFQTETQFAFDKENSILCCKITTNMKQDDKPLLKAELLNFFDIEPSSVDSLCKDGKIVFAPMLLIQFASLGYGSIRGVIFAKTMGTQLANIILPPVYFGTMIDKPFVVEK